MYKQVVKLLKAIGVYLSVPYLRTRLESHPDYPSLSSIQDSLEELGIVAYGCVGTNEQLIKENRPFLAHFHIAAGGDLQYFKSMKNAYDRVKDFDRHWSGYVMFIDKPEKYGNTEHDKQYKKEKSVQTFGMISLIVFATVLMAVPLSNGNILDLLLMLSNIVGLYFSWLVIQKELGISNSISDKICSMAKHSRCESVLFSKGAKLFSWLTWGDVGIVYFTSSLFFLLLSYLENIPISLFQCISLTGLIFPIYSIYYQRKVVKQWCMLCIGVLGALFISGIISGFKLYKSEFISPGYNSILLFTGISLATLGIWLFIKSLYERSLASVAKEIEAARLKRNPQVFNALLEKQELKIINQREDDEPIHFGNPLGQYQIIVACNPYCKPCAKAHHALEALYEKYPDKLSIAIRFALHTNDDKDIKTLAAKEILKAASQKPFEAVKDWYRLFSLDKFKELYRVNGLDVNDAINKHISWSKEVGINATPTLFVNGRRLPELYSWKEFIEILDYELKQ